jgi:hypothetical protein
MGRVSGFWSLAGLVVTAWIVVDVLRSPKGTAAAFSGITGLTSTVGNQITGAKTA